ncbi:hypothetical protein, partial [Butyricimonas virosa]|uniref:hypothetical protein n=1 Tax=Butyricimonas virosa TaxID=544645 RepID=UPI00397770CC
GFAEKDITYDLNGNLTSLTRTSSSGVASSLSYTYDGNQVSKINNGPSYAYDTGGNMTVDGLRGISISYNILSSLSYTYDGNQVSKINNGSSYAYDAGGNMTVDGLRGASISYNILNLP